MNGRLVMFTAVLVLVALFVFAERSLIPPLVVAFIFAYILNPVVNVLHKKIRIPRSLSIILVYSLIIGLVVFTSNILARQVAKESQSFTRETNIAAKDLATNIDQLPDWIQPSAENIELSLRRGGILGVLLPNSLTPSLNGAFTRLTAFVIFLFSGYYLLQDGETIIGKLVNTVSEARRKDVITLLGQINMILGSYLRGQLFLIFIVALMLYVALTIVGIRYSLSLAIFSGFAETIPLVGPILAAAIAVSVVFLTGGVTHFVLSPFNASIIVIAIYFVVRQFEDYFILPHVMGRITKLSPFVIFLAVVAGGHLWGVLGLIIAVPTVAIGRLISEFVIRNFYKLS